MLQSDNPIQHAREDKMNRKKFAEQLADTIISYTNQSNITIGLYGKWGSGKTSILNMVKERIVKKTQGQDDIKPIIVDFNPWNYSESSQLLTQFFNTIIIQLKQQNKSEKLTEVSAALQNYADFIEYAAYIPVIGKYLLPLKGLLQGVGKDISERVERQDSLDVLKERVKKLLINQRQKIIVIIDDIDRLNNDQIRLIFQLVNCLAGFPNIIYLLSFDKDVVVRALAEEQNCSGEEYLEKIIQVPFEVPDVSAALIYHIFYDFLKDILFDSSLDNDEYKYLEEVLSASVFPFIRSVRDVKRVINVFNFKYGFMHSETNVADLLALTTFQTLVPQLYVWIRQNRYLLTGSSYGRSWIGTEQKDLKQKMLDEFQSLYHDPDVVLRALQVLFPKFSSDTGKIVHFTETEDELRYRQKISCYDRFKIYFQLSLEDIPITNNMICESLNNYDSERLDDMFSDLIETGEINNYLIEIKAHIKDIPENRRKMFLEKFMNLEVLTTRSTYYCSDCIWSILRSLDIQTAGKILISLADEVNEDTLFILVGIVYDIDCSYGRIGNNNSHVFRVITEDALDTLENKIFSRVLKILKHKCLFDIPSYLKTIVFWEYKDKQSMDEYIHNILNEPINVPKFLNWCVRIWENNIGTGWTFETSTVSEYIDTDEAYKKIVTLKGQNAFRQLSFDLQEIALAYYLWYNAGKKDDQRISKKDVDGLIKAWEQSK